MALRHTNGYFSPLGFLFGFSIFAIGMIMISGGLNVIHDNLLDSRHGRLAGVGPCYYLGEVLARRTDPIYDIDIASVSMITLTTNSSGEILAHCTTYDYTSTPSEGANITGRGTYSLGTVDLSLPDDSLVTLIGERLETRSSSVKQACYLRGFSWETDKDIPRRILRAVKQNP